MILFRVLQFGRHSGVKRFLKSLRRIFPVVPCLAAATTACSSGEPAEVHIMLRAWPDESKYTIGVGASMEYPSIQSGIDAASPGDTVLVFPGTYYENIDFLGKEIVVTSMNGSGHTIIDGRGLGSVVTAASGEPEGAELSGFTIRNGISDTGYGGGVVCDNGCELKICDNHIKNNNATRGGGVSVNQSHITITNNEIVNNDTNWDGGGIYCLESDLGIYRNSITENLGSGIAAEYSQVEIMHNEISRNYDTGGGGFNAYYCSIVRVFNNLIIDNEDAWGGGGMRLRSNDSVFVFNNTVAYNITEEEGANIHLYRIDYVEISNNIIAFGLGGAGIYNCGQVEKCIIEYNDAYSNEGFDYFNVAPGAGSMSFDPLLDEEYNLDWRSPCIDMGDPSMTPPAGGGERIDIGASEFPYFPDPPVTIEVLSIPDTVNTGSAADWSLSLVNGTRPEQHVDLFVSFMKVDHYEQVFEKGYFLEPWQAITVEGSFEFGEFFNAGDWEIIARAGIADSVLYVIERKPFHVFRAPRIIDVPGDFNKIQHAINVAVEGDTILVGAGTYFETLDFLGKGVILASASGPDSTKITDDSASYVITCEYGAGRRGYLIGFTIDREGWPENTAIRAVDFPLSVLDCRFSGWERAVSGMGASDLRVSGCEISDCEGGILISGATNLEISGSRIFDTYSSQGVLGGGIGCSGASICQVRDCLFFSIYNYCSWADGYGWGGGVGLADSASCRIETSELLSNTANGGGGIYMGDNTVLDVRNSIISNNSRSGIEIMSEKSVDIRNCFINSNVGTNYGGGLLFWLSSDGSVSLANSEICGNSVSPGYMSYSGSGGGVNFFTTANNNITLENCLIRGNSVTGGDEANHVGGGLYKSGDGEFLMLNTEITGNRLGKILHAGYNQGAGANIHGGGIVENNVIYCNSIYNGEGEGAGLRLSDFVTVTNSIIRENTPDQIYVYNINPVLNFSNIEDGWPGEGNIDADPLFVAPSYDHYSLSPGSPCIDTGDPEILDPDGTISDMGAYGGPGAKPVNMTLPVTSLTASPGGTLEFDIILSNSTSGRIDATIHAILRGRADLADVRLLGNGELSLPTNTSRLITASGLISPGLEPGSYYIHLYTTNNLKNDPIEFSNINLEITG